MVSAGKAETSLLNKYLKTYEELMLGQTSSTSTNTNKEDLYKHMEAFQSAFKDKVTFIPKVGKRLDKEFENISMEELIKSEIK